MHNKLYLHACPSTCNMIIAEHAYAQISIRTGYIPLIDDFFLTLE